MLNEKRKGKRESVEIEIQRITETASIRINREVGTGKIAGFFLLADQKINS